MSEPKLLSTAEVARRLGVTRAWAARLIEKGHIKGQKVGGSYVVRAEDLEQFERRPVGRPRKGEGE